VAKIKQMTLTGLCGGDETKPCRPDSFFGIPFACNNPSTRFAHVIPSATAAGVPMNDANRKHRAAAMSSQLFPP